MPHTAQELRSMLFVPADRDRFIEKAVADPIADAIIVDLEDGMSSARRESIRHDLGPIVRALTTAHHVAVRVNNDADLDKDIEAAVAAGANAVMLPKVGGVDDVSRCADLLDRAEVTHHRSCGETGIHLLIESAIGLHRVVDIVRAHQRVRSLVLGVEDFCEGLGVDPTAEHADLRWAHGRILEAAAIADVTPLGFLGSITNIADMATYRRDAIRSRQFGYRGSLCVHPRQAEVLNEAFLPTDAEVHRAIRIIEAAGSTADATFAVDGRMVDAPVIKRAQRVLAQAARDDRHHNMVAASGWKQAEVTLRAAAPDDADALSRLRLSWAAERIDPVEPDDTHSPGRRD